MKFITKLTILSLAATFSFDAFAQVNEFQNRSDSTSEYKKTIEINVLNLVGKHQHFNSDGGFGEILSFDDRSKSTEIKTIPLEFRFELENKSWGLLSDVNLKNNVADIGVYNIFSSFKFGAGVLVSYEIEQNIVEFKNIKQAGSASTTSNQISPYLLLKKNLIEDESSTFEYWGKAGVAFLSKKSDTLEIKYTALFLNPGFDYYYNINRSFSVGTGLSVKYSILNGSADDFAEKIDGNGEIFSYQLGLFKLKYIF